MKNYKETCLLGPLLLKQQYSTTHWYGIVEYKSLNTINQLKHIGPITYQEALLKPECKRVMDLEILALEQNKTWELVHLPKGKKSIGSKWVFKEKRKANGTLERYKARLEGKVYN